MAIVLVEQFFDFAYELGDEFTVMKRGAVSFNRRADGLDRQTLYDAVTV
jgi:urea transport system ATP-binding protein